MTTVAIASTHTGQGYWTVSADGTVAAHGDAQPLDASELGDVGTIVAAASTPDGKGLWLVDESGNVHALGAAAVAAPPENLEEAEPEAEPDNDNEGDDNDNAPEPV